MLFALTLFWQGSSSFLRLRTWGDNERLGRWLFWGKRATERNEGRATELEFGSIKGRSSVKKKKLLPDSKNGLTRQNKAWLSNRRLGSKVVPPSQDRFTLYLIWAFCQREETGGWEDTLPVQLKSLEQTHKLNHPHILASLQERNSDCFPCEAVWRYQVQLSDEVWISMKEARSVQKHLMILQGKLGLWPLSQRQETQIWFSVT